MKLIDTHAHLYVHQFDEDIDLIIQRAIECGIEKILLPNIDTDSIDALIKLWQSNTKLFCPMMGLHPSSVENNYIKNLDTVFKIFDEHPFIAVGEIGLDYYWTTEYISEQKDAFVQQIKFALSKGKPIAVHCRDSFDDILNILEKEQNGKLNGVLHCFTGNEDEARRLVQLGFKMGIGGVLTFKNSGLDKTIEKFDISHFILETDSPYLAPHPYRGKRNESSYIKLVAQKMADIYGISTEEVAQITSHTARALFHILD
jgi:TatD DNase family protein